MYRTDVALEIVGWAPYVACLLVSLFQPRSWSTLAKAAYAVVWLLLGWLLVVAHVELAQLSASVMASTDEQLLELYSSDGAERAFAALFGWWLPLAGLVSGFALQALLRKQQRSPK